jgi:hypothetical protein
LKGIRLDAGDPGKRLLQRQDREQYEFDRHREACDHQDLGSSISCAEVPKFIRFLSTSA